MNVRVPLYLQERKLPGTRASQFQVRPLFFDRPQRRGQQLSRVMAQTSQDLRKLLDAHAQQPRQNELLEWTFCPAVQTHALAVPLTLRRQTARLKVMAVAFEALDRRVAFFPQIPDLWFEVLRGQHIKDRAADVLSDYFLKLEREEKELRIPTVLVDGGREWVATIQLDVNPAPKLSEPNLEHFLSLASGQRMDGRTELQKVGRCLDWLYPDELDRVVHRDAEVDELERRLSDPDRRPVLLLGPRQAGKTALVHEAVFRRVDRRKNPYTMKHNVWLLAPQRLISGMSYVGQWENRLLAILDHAKKSDHVLYFDDLLGLFHAGVSASSDLAVAHVLRPYVERRDVRVLGEITSEAFHVLQERDRGLADLFHVISVREMSPSQTRRVMASLMRQVEPPGGCRFELDSMPAMLDIQQRYVRDLALPGKVAGVMRRLALRHRGQHIDRNAVLQDFHAQSGLSMAFLDGNVKLERQEIVQALHARIVGQETAIEVMADVVCIAKARLNDPTRPLASFLFLGPTGVGKTECAKALARYLFGDAERLVRFDMNGYIDPASVSRLIGTFDEPEGLLTAALRRQPFSVVLLDEIEKAHSAVFDLLLQVLGEGRLTDARGRTADFSNAIIVMTSNLGTREAGSVFGLRPPDRSDRDVYLSAAQRFFRPEIYNRIDRIVPFERLTREQVAGIAHHLIGDVFRREGLVHRRCVLEVDPAAMVRIVDAGYHPQLGARALKRAIERQITQPVARRLAATPPGAPAVIQIMAGPDGVLAGAHPLANVQPRRDLRPARLGADVDATLDAIDEAIDRIERQADSLEPAGQLTQGRLSTEQYRYLAIREQAALVRRLVQRVDQMLTARKPSPRSRPGVRLPRPTRVRRAPDADPPVWKDLLAAESLQSELHDLLESAAAEGEDIPSSLSELLDECALLEAMARPDSYQRVMIVTRSIPALATPEQKALGELYSQAFQRQHGAVVERTAGAEQIAPAECLQALVAEMPGAAELFQAEQGTHLFVPAHGNIAPVQVLVQPLEQDADANRLLQMLLHQRQAWRDALKVGRASVDGDPMRIGAVVRVYDQRSSTLDLTTGMMAEELPTPAQLRRFLLARLPLPVELTTEDG